jgi:hypothetical protein
MKGLSRWIHGEPLLAVMLWGGNYPVVRLALREIPVLNLTFLRFTLGGKDSRHHRGGTGRVLSPPNSTMELAFFRMRGCNDP